MFGKAGEAETPTDPAPLSMFETVVTLKPAEQWRPGMTWEKIDRGDERETEDPRDGQHLLDADPDPDGDADDRLPLVLGVKVFGPDLAGIQKVGDPDRAGADGPARTPGASSPSGRPEATSWTSTVNRAAAARYGLTVGDVNDVIETAIGGKTIATTVEGRERYPISVRYARDYREDIWTP